MIPLHSTNASHLRLAALAFGLLLGLSSPKVLPAYTPTGDAAQSGNTREVPPTTLGSTISTTGPAGTRPLVFITAPDPEAIRSNGKPARFTVTRGGDVSQPLTVALNATGSTASVAFGTDPVYHPAAVVGVDYQPLPATVTIPVGAASADVPLAPGAAGARSLNEADLGYGLSLAVLSGGDYEVGTPAAALAEIYQTDCVLSISSAQPLATLVPPQSARFTVRRRGGSTGQPIYFQLGGSGTARPVFSTFTGFDPTGPIYSLRGDYTLTPFLAYNIYPPQSDANAVLPASDSSQDFSLSIRPGDAVPPQGLTVVFDLYQTRSAYRVDDHQASVTVQLLPVPPPTVITVAAKATSLAEGTHISLVFARVGGDLSCDLTVRYTLSGAAVAGSRIMPPGGTVVIPAGSAKAKVKVFAVDDGIAEGPQTLKVKLQAGDGYSLGSPARVKLLILDPQT